MAHQRISEYRAKVLLSSVLKNQYTGVEVTASSRWRAAVGALPNRAKYVIKVDQAVKGRFKQGLVAINLNPEQVSEKAKQFFSQGYTQLLVEPYVAHSARHERYLALRRSRSGISIMYSAHGGVDIEQNHASVNQSALRPASQTTAARVLGIPSATLKQLVDMFNEQHLGFLEINPLLVAGARIVALDAAAVVDDAAVGIAGTGWTRKDFRQPAGRITHEEQVVTELDSYTPSSFSLKVLNPHGQIYVLLSGGGASLVVVDEICHQGAGKLLGNYGEYSGNPSASEVLTYTRQILTLLLQSKSRPKVLLIAGGVANFTDIRTTFEGVTLALDEHKNELREQGVKIFVRRGGPGAGIAVPKLEKYLQKEHLLGGVWGPEQSLVMAVTEALRPLTEAASL